MGMCLAASATRDPSHTHHLRKAEAILRRAQKDSERHILWREADGVERLELSRILLQPPCQEILATGLLEGGDAQLALVGIGDLHQR